MGRFCFLLYSCVQVTFCIRLFSAGRFFRFDEIILMRARVYSFFFTALLRLAFMLPAGMFYAVAQDPHPAFRNYTVQDGLSNSEVYQVMQDSRGYLWFATGSGVSRFNGYSFETFSVKEGIFDNTIFEIREDRLGRIWFLSITCMLSYYDYGDRRIHLYEHNDVIREAVSYPFKCSFHIMDDGTIYLGLYDDGIYKITPEGTMTLCNKSPYENTAVHVQEPEKGQFAFTNGSYSDRCILLIERMGQAPRLYEADKKLVRGERVSRVISMENGDVLMGYADVLYIIQKSGEMKHVLFPSTVQWLYEDSDNELWIGTYSDGAYHVKDMDFERKRRYLPGQSITGIIEDHEGGFWFSDMGGSVFYTPSKKILAYDETSGFRSDRINCVEVADSTVYAGGQDGYIYYFTPDGSMHGINLNTASREFNSVNKLFYDPSRSELIYSGTFSGGKLNVKTMRRGKMIGVFNNRMIDSKGRHWASYSRGMGFERNDTIVAVGERKRVYAQLRWGPDHLLTGGIDGLWLFNKSTYEYTAFAGTLLRQNRIADMSRSGDSILFIGTKGAGIFICTPRRVMCIDESTGLCGDQVNRLRVYGNTIWVATTRGINRIDLSPHDPFTYSIRRITMEDGLISDEASDLIVLGNTLWVATKAGLCFLDADHNPGGSDEELPVYIDRVSINGTDTLPTAFYDLQYDHNNVQISFLAAGYHNAGKHLYRYRMQGLDTGWTYTRNREIQFTTLPAGSYQFSVEVQNRNGKWSSTPAMVTFLVRAPFWKKAWFQAAMMGALLIIVAALVRYFSRRQQQRKAKNETLNRNLMNLKLKALRAQMNPHFIFNVMNSIQHFIMHKDEESAHRYLSKFSRLVRVILNNSEKDAVSIGEEVVALELYLQLESMRFEQAFHYEIKIDPAIDQQEVHIPSMLIQPYVENAIHHGIYSSPRKGDILVEIRRDGDTLVCIIEDNGIGRKGAAHKKKSGHKSFGTTITKERLVTLNALHNSSLSEKIIDLYNQDGAPAGTRVEIYIALTTDKL